MAKQGQALVCPVCCVEQEEQKPRGFPPHSGFRQVTTLPLSCISPPYINSVSVRKHERKINFCLEGSAKDKLSFKAPPLLEQQ